MDGWNGQLDSLRIGAPVINSVRSDVMIHNPPFLGPRDKLSLDLLLSSLASKPPRLVSAGTVHQYVQSVSTYLSLSPAHRPLTITPRLRRNQGDYDDYPPTVRAAANHQPTRPVDKEKNEAELSVNIKKATNAEETAPSECLSSSTACV